MLSHKLVLTESKNFTSDRPILAPPTIPKCRRAFTILPATATLNWAAGTGSFTLKKLECLKQAFAMNTLAWNNNLGLRFYFVGFYN